MRPEHHHPASKFDPVAPSGDAKFAGHQDPGIDNTAELGHTAGQPDTWPQRTEIQAKHSSRGWPFFGKVAD